MSDFCPISFGASTSGMCPIPLDTTQVSVAGQELVNCTPAFYSPELEERKWSLILGEPCLTEIEKQLEEPAKEGFWTSAWNGFKNVASAINKAVSFPGTQAASAAKEQEEERCERDNVSAARFFESTPAGLRGKALEEVFPKFAESFNTFVKKKPERAEMKLEAGAFLDSALTVAYVGAPGGPVKGELHYPVSAELAAKIKRSIPDDALSIPDDALIAERLGLGMIELRGSHSSVDVSFRKIEKQLEEPAKEGFWTSAWSRIKSVAFSINKAVSFPGAQAAPASSDKSHPTPEQLKAELFNAVKNGELSRTRTLLATVDANSVDEEGMTPLHWAAYKAELSITEEILKHNPNTNVLDKVGRAPLHLAIVHGELFITLAMLQAGADPNLPTRKGNSPLKLAITNDERSIAEALLEAGADVNAIDENGNTPLHLAVSKGALFIAEKILARKPNMNLLNAVGSSPLHSSILRSELSITKAMLRAGADPNLLTKGGCSPLNLAIEWSGYSFEDLLYAGADPDLLDKKGRRPLHLAIQERKYFFVEALLKKKADPTKVDGCGKTAMDRALETGDCELMDLLVQYKKSQSSDE